MTNGFNIYRQAMFNEQSDFADKISIQKMTEKCQREFPGNYVVQETYMPGRHYWRLTLRFDSPGDETWFLLQHG
jgi:hypothetical protein